MNPSAQHNFHELSFYTLSHPDTIYFIHQHVVDAFQAQHADAQTKPITLTFSLAGLYLYLEKGYSGRQVQQAHMRLARNKQKWPAIELPDARGDITVTHVLKAPPGPLRDTLIRAWCLSVWTTYRKSHALIAALVDREVGKAP